MCTPIPNFRCRRNERRVWPPNAYARPVSRWTTGVGKTGVVGLFRNGDGPTVMLRADMDALPIKEDTGLPYASKVTAKDSGGKPSPVGHMCGHDMHVAWLVGAAKMLSETRSTLARHADGGVPAR